MFHLITGTPGAGKTLSTIDMLRKITDRKIYYFNIPGLKLDWTEIKNPLDYHNEIPDGSIFVLDECQKYFPVRPPKDAVPAAISFIETHRHRGIDIYFITQHPNLLDHHARRLIGSHTHLQRNFGMPFAVKYTNNKLFDFANWHELQSCEKTQYQYPKDVFNLYKSAEIHTHKAKFPKKLLWLLLLLPPVIIGPIYIYNMLHNDKISPVPSYSIHKNSETGQVDNSTINVKNDKTWTTAFIPAVPGLPYTAPIYAELAVPVVLPVVAGCVASKDKCQCYTQQASKVDMSQELCRLQVRNHVFNPFKKDDDNLQIAENSTLKSMPVSNYQRK